MAVTARAFPQMIVKAFNKEIDLDTDTIKAMLVTGYSFDASDVYVSDIGAVQVTGTGYTAGGITLASKTVGVSSGVFSFDAADISWPDSTISATGLVLYDAQTATAATEPLLGYVDFGATVASSAGSFDIEFDADGIINIPVS